MASSPDDLYPGQMVTYRNLKDGKWQKPTRVIEIEHNPPPRVDCVRLEGNFVAFKSHEWVILSDPPPSPVKVSRKRLDDLATALEGDSWHRVVFAARCLVDEAKEES